MANRPRHTGFGSTYNPVNNLAVVEAYMKVNEKLSFKPIIQNGQWSVKKLDFAVDDRVTIRTGVVGQGFGYLYLSFEDSEQTQLLAIKKVIAGSHDISFIVPYMSLPGFRVGVASTIPTGYGIDLLSKETQYKIRTNSLMMNQHKPMYESPGIGFGGFGALADQNINDTPRGGQDSGGNPYWSGSLDNFSWGTYGYSGDRAVYTSSANVPEAYGEYHGYYANRCSLMMAKFDESDRFLGWDTIEGSSNNMPKVPTGVPLCLVMQFFVNNRQGEDKGNQDPRKAKDPYWIAAQDYQLDPSKILFIEDNWRVTNFDASAPKDAYPRYDNKKGVIKQVGRAPVFSPYGGETWDSMASKVEWYDTSRGTWSSPSAHPPHIPMTNIQGFTKLIFRIPRQLSPETDKDIIEQLSSAGISYDYNTTKKCFPVSTWTKDAPTSKAYGLVGRPNDSETFYQENGEWYFAPKISLRLQLFFEYANHPKAGYTNHQRDGNEPRGNPKPGKVPVIGTNVAFSDVEKMARMNYPELMYAFYPSTGFVTNGRIYAIGRGLSTSTTTCISTTRDKDPSVVYPTQVTNPDGSQIGTTEAARIAPKQLILSTDLLDTVNSVGEEKLQQHWQEKFGKPLDINFFKGDLLKDAVPERPHMYRVRDPDSGLYIEAPYQIMIFEIESDYTGPAIFYTTTTDEKEVTVEGVTKIEKKTSLVVTKPEGKPYARGKNEPIFLNTRTPFGYIRHQEIDVVEEVTQQIELLDKGLSPEDVIKVNELDNPPGDSTVAIMEQEVQDQYITAMEVLRARQEGSNRQESAPPAKQATRKLVRLRDVLNPFPGNYVEQPISGLKGFSNSRDFYVEDVTSKWTAQGSAGLGGIIDETVAPFLRDEIEDIWRGGKNFVSTNANLAVKATLAVVLGGVALKKLIKIGASTPNTVNENAKSLGKRLAGRKFRGTAARRRAARRR
jgi:hypothetical protein